MLGFYDDLEVENDQAGYELRSRVLGKTRLLIVGDGEIAFAKWENEEHYLGQMYKTQNGHLLICFHLRIRCSDALAV